MLPNDAEGRTAFVTSGGFAKVQQIAATQAGSDIKEFVDVINSCYPEEIVRYYSPNYAAALLEKLESATVSVSG